MKAAWAPVDSRAFASKVEVVDLEKEADCADAHLQNARDTVPDLLLAAAALTEKASSGLRAISVETRSEHAFKYEEAGGVIAAAELARLIASLAEALSYVASAQAALAESNVSMAASELVEWPIPPGRDDAGGDDGGPAAPEFEPLEPEDSAGIRSVSGMRH